jgi:hypothetical protein
MIQTRFTCLLETNVAKDLDCGRLSYEDPTYKKFDTVFRKVTYENKNRDA